MKYKTSGILQPNETEENCCSSHMLFIRTMGKLQPENP